MSVLNLVITSGRPDSWLQSNFETPGGQHAIAQRIINYLNSVQSGTEKAAGVGSPPSVAISVQGNETAADGAFIFAGPPDPNDSVIINGIIFTAVASGATGDQFNIGVDAETTAINLADAINASSSALIAKYVTAEAVNQYTVLTSKFLGTAGNMCSTVVYVNVAANMSVDGPRLSGGLADPSAQTLNF